MTPTTGIRRQQPRRVFKDRREAGQVLAGLLEAYRGRPDVVVLGLARGGIPVAYEVAKALGVPLDAFIVRKLGAPGHEEFAVGALASGGRPIMSARAAISYARTAPTGRPATCPLASSMPSRSSGDRRLASIGCFVSRMISWIGRKRTLLATRRAWSSRLTRLSCLGTSPSTRRTRLTWTSLF